MPATLAGTFVGSVRSSENFTNRSNFWRWPKKGCFAEEWWHLVHRSCQGFSKISSPIDRPQEVLHVEPAGQAGGGEVSKEKNYEKTISQRKILPIECAQCDQPVRCPWKITTCRAPAILNWFLTELFLDWTVPWLHCSLTELFLDCTVPWLNFTWLHCSLAELFLDWTVTWLNCYLTEVFLDWTVTLLNCYFAELICYSTKFTKLVLFWTLCIFLRNSEVSQLNLRQISRKHRG